MKAIVLDFGDDDESADDDESVDKISCTARNVDGTMDDPHRPNECFPGVQCKHYQCSEIDLGDDKPDFLLSAGLNIYRRWCDYLDQDIWVIFHTDEICPLGSWFRVDSAKMLR